MPEVAASSDSQRYHRLAAVGLAAVVPGRVAVVLPLLRIAPLLLVVLRVLLLSQGCFFLRCSLDLSKLRCLAADLLRM